MEEIGVVTVGERPTRVSVALVGLLLAGAAGLVRTEWVAGTITVAAVVWLLFALVGVGQLAVAVHRALR
jgi:CDP-diacylglycerol--glycerol-3-phosphate 3-phosphatidyltransferase